MGSVTAFTGWSRMVPPCYRTVVGRGAHRQGGRWRSTLEARYVAQEWDREPKLPRTQGLMVVT